MARLQSANNAEATLINGIAPSDTSFQVSDASVFPTPPFRITVNAEIMEVTAKNNGTNTFTSVLRGQEGTTAANHSSGASVQNRFTAGTHEELVSQDELTSVQNSLTTTIQGVESSLTGEIGTVDTRVDGVESDVGDLQTALSQLSDTVSDEMGTARARLFRSKSSSQTISDANTWTSVSFNKAITENGITTDNITHTVPEAGIYLIAVAFNFGSTVSGPPNNYLLGRIDVSNVQQYRIGGTHSTSNGNISVSGSVITLLSAGATIRAQVSVGVGGCQVIGLSGGDERTYIMIQKL